MKEMSQKWKQSKRYWGNMLRLLHVQIDNKILYDYGTVCEFCGEKFLYTSANSLLRQIWDKDFFEMEFARHKCECISNRVERSLNENKA